MAWWYSINSISVPHTIVGGVYFLTFTFRVINHAIGIIAKQLKSLIYRRIILPNFILLLLSFNSNAQSFKLHGTVYDYFSKKPLDAVTVYSSAGKHAITDSAGKYAIDVAWKDSVWFSYLNKATQKYPVDTISNPVNFEVALYVNIAWLPEVKVRSNSYHLDSLQNRLDYAKYFNFRKPGVRLTSASPASSYVPGSVTVGIDLDELINMFRFKRNRRIENLQTRLIQQEQDKYIDHRFTKYFVRQLTKIDSAELENFMAIYRPDYYYLLLLNDIDFGQYIQQCYKNYLYVKRNPQLQPANRR